MGGQRTSIVSAKLTLVLVRLLMLPIAWSSISWER